MPVQELILPALVVFCLRGQEVAEAGFGVAPAQVMLEHYDPAGGSERCLCCTSRYPGTRQSRELRL